MPANLREHQVSRDGTDRRVAGVDRPGTGLGEVCGFGEHRLTPFGGVSFRGDSRRVYVQQPNGNVRAVHRRPFPFGTSKPIPEPGAVIVVPVRDTTAQGNAGVVLSGVAQILAALTTIAVVIVTRK